jgi:hypothetical protein
MWLQIVLFTVLSPWVSMQLEGQPKGQPTHHQSTPDAKEAQPQDSQQGMKDAPIFVQILQDPQSAADAAKAKKDSDSKELYDLLTAGSAVFAAVFTWVMHTKSTPRDDSARLVAGRQ